MSNGRPRRLRGGSFCATTAGLVFGVPACTPLLPYAGFQEVQSSVKQRSGQHVAWRGVSEADRTVDAQVDALLQDAISADEAIQVALLNNRQLQATYEELGIAQADLVEAGLLKNPIFEVQYRWPGRPANPWEIHVIQDFLDVFFVPLRRRAAAAALEAAKFRVAGAAIDHAAKTQQAFYRLQSAEQLADMSKTVVDAAEASSMLAQRQHQAGNISDLDLAQEQALLAQARIELARAQAEALERREVLNEDMGLRGADATAWTVGPRLPEPQPDNPAPGELESLALAQRLDLLAAQQRIESLAQSLGLARSSALIPTLDVGAHVEREPDGPATWGPSMELPVPVFNRGRPRVARAHAELRRSQQEYLALAAKIEAEVRSAQNRMRSAKNLTEHYQLVMLPLRGQIVQESQLHYNAMQIGPLQLLQARQAELEAGKGYIQALESYWIARTDLERAVGGRLSPSEQVAGHAAAVDEREPDHEH